MDKKGEGDRQETLLVERGERAPGWTISELWWGEEALGGRRERRFHSPKCSQKRGGDEKQVGGRKKEKGLKEDGSRAAKAISPFPPPPNLLWGERFAPRFDGKCGYICGRVKTAGKLFRISACTGTWRSAVENEHSFSRLDRGSGGESQIKKNPSPFLFPPLTSGTRNTGLLQTFLSSSISLLLLLLHTKYITPPPSPSSSPFPIAPISKVSHGPGETKREEVPYLGTSECN